MRGRLFIAVLGVLAVSALGPIPGAASTSQRSTSNVAVSAASAANGAWTVYHRDDAHTGYDPTQPNAATAVGGWTSPTLDGAVYAEPLVFNGFVYTATLSGTVYALNQSDGTIAWSRNVGQPHPKDATNQTLCGNVDPMGILSTPVIDTAANRIYVAELLNSDTTWHVFGIDLTTHGIVLNTQIKSSVGTGLDWTIQQQRGALALANGYVYVPFGGRAGDCGPYHGWVIGVPTSGSTSLAVYESPSTAEGVWAAGGPVIDDSTGNVFFATGNAIPCTNAVNSDSVIRTAPGLGAATSFFQPNDWSNHWCGPDSDLGSTSPVLINSGLMFMTGKYGQGFLLNPANLGGKDGQLFPAQAPYTGIDVCHGTHSDATFGSFAYAAPFVYIACQGDGMVGLSIDTTAKSFTACSTTCPSPNWFTAEATTLGPPIVAGGAVWAVSTDGAGLYAFNAATGAVIYHSAAFPSHRFSTPSEAGGQIFVGAGDAIQSFNMISGCSSVTLSATPPTSTTSGSPVTVTASATGPACTSPQYEFWLRSSAGAWSVVQPYGASSTFNWTNTTPAGSYFLGVHARDAVSTAPYETVASIPYTLTAQICSAVTLAAAPASGQPSGTPVTLTATGTCPNPNPLYEFWAKWQGSSSWQLLRGYTTSNTFNWNSTGALPGTETFGVWVHDASNTNAYDTFTSIPFTVTASTCTSVTASANPTSVTHGTGTHVTITGTASGCTHASPQYEFWMRPASSSTWQLVQGWSTAATYDWNSTGALPGTVYFGVWTKDAASTNTYDAVVSTTVTVT